MKTFKGTNGKWSQVQHYNEQHDLCIHSGEHGLIAQLSPNTLMHTRTTLAEMEANAKLIAAAPELLETLQKLKLNPSECEESLTIALYIGRQDFSKLRQVINKAL